MDGPSAPAFSEDQLLGGLTDYRLARNFWIASLVILIYEYTLTFGQEMAYMGSPAHRRAPKFLFLISRYWPTLNLTIANTILASSDLSNRFCLGWIVWIACTAQPSVISTNFILILRIYAMFGRKKLVLWTLSCLFVATLVAEITVLTIVLLRIQAAPAFPTLHYTGCILLNHERLAWLYYFIMAMFQAVLFVLAMIRSAQVYIHDRREGLATSHTFFVLARDSLLYFGLVVMVVATNCFVWGLGRESLFAMFIPMTMIMSSIIGCRMVLNAHKVLQQHRMDAHGLSTISRDGECGDASENVYTLNDMTGHLRRYNARLARLRAL